MKITNLSEKAEAVSTKEATIKHTCGHKTVVTVDNSVKGWVKHYAEQVCFECQATEEVTHICGHITHVARGFQSPRRMESAAMQMCHECQ